jgi:hypothetical protein
MHAGVIIVFNDVSQETDFAGSQARCFDFHVRIHELGPRWRTKTC